MQSQDSDQFKIRMPDGLRDQIKAAADANGRSMNAEIIHRLTAPARDPRAGLMMLHPDGRAEPIHTDRPLTAGDLADALSCFWNGAIGEAHRQQDGMPTAAIMATGLQAVEQRLREIGGAA